MSAATDTLRISVIIILYKNNNIKQLVILLTRSVSDMNGDIIMSDSIGTREASKKWGYTQATVQKWCREGLILGADQDGKGCPWRIPKKAKCPFKVKK